MKKFYLLLLFVFVSLISLAQPLAAYDKSNGAGPTAAFTTNSISALGFTRGSGVAFATPENINFSTNNWNNTSSAGAIADDEYIQWSVSADVGFEFQIGELQIRLRTPMAGAGPGDFLIQYSNDNFATAGTDLGPPQTLTPGTATTYTFNSFTPAINSGVSGTITFRLYAWNAGTSSGLLRINTSNALDEFNSTNNGCVISGFTTPVSYIFDAGVWSPSNPNGASTAADLITIQNGDATITTNTTASTISIADQASLTVNSGINLSASSILMNSTSENYSSLLVLGTVGGSTVINYDRYVNIVGSGAIGTGGNDLISFPIRTAGMEFQDFLDYGPSIGNENSSRIPNNSAGGNPNLYAFGPYDNNIVDYVNYEGGSGGLNETTPIVRGKGYRAATNAVDQTLRFTGFINKVNVTLPLEVNTNFWNLVGNPYPTYLNSQTFLSANTAVLDDSAEAIYGYNSGTASGTGTVGNFTIINNLVNTGLNIAPGQGFFVAAASPAGNLAFNLDMRTISGSDDFILGKMENNTQMLRLKLANSNSDFATELYFDENATLGLDPGYDTSLYEGMSSNLMIYSHLVDDNNGVDLAIQALGSEDFNNTTIPLGVKASQGEQLTFSLEDSTLYGDVKIYLQDTETNTFTLLNSSDYTVNLNTNLNGTGRFYLTTTAESLSILDQSKVNLEIFSTQNNLHLRGQLLEDSKITAYDVQGREVFSSLIKAGNTSENLDISNLTTGIYIVRALNSKQEKTQKIIIR